MTAPAGVLVIANAWPPMAAGTGRALSGMVADRRDTVVLAPRQAQTREGGARVLPVFRFSDRAGGRFKIYSALQHLEIVLGPFVWWLTQRGRRRPEVLICIQPLFAGVAGLLMRRLFRVPYVVLVYGEELTTWYRDPAPFQARRRLLERVLREAAMVVGCAGNSCRLAAELYQVPSAKLRVIYPAIDVTEARTVDAAAADELRRRLVGERGRMLLVVGRLWEAHKGFDTAIDALPEILREFPEAHLVVAGPGDPAAWQERARERGVADRVTFVGHVDRKTLLQLFAACEIFLLPGRAVAGSAEGFGVVYLEAALAGKPVVAGREGGAPEAVVDGETGVLVDGHSPAEVAAAVVALLRDPARAAALGARGRERVERDFSGRRQHEQLADVLAAVRNGAAG